DQCIHFLDFVEPKLDWLERPAKVGRQLVLIKMLLPKIKRASERTPLICKRQHADFGSFDVRESPEESGVFFKWIPFGHGKEIAPAEIRIDAACLLTVDDVVCAHITPIENGPAEVSNFSEHIASRKKQINNI